MYIYVYVYVVAGDFVSFENFLVCYSVAPLHNNKVKLYLHAFTCLCNVPSGDEMSSASFIEGNGATSGYMKIHVCDRRNLYQYSLDSKKLWICILFQYIMHT